MENQYRENGARNTCSKDNQLILNTLQTNKKYYTFLNFFFNFNFPSSNARNFQDSGKVLAVSLSEFCQSIAVLGLFLGISTLK